jgi:hypothetical protein
MPWQHLMPCGLPPPIVLFYEQFLPWHASSSTVSGRGKTIDGVIPDAFGRAVRAESVPLCRLKSYSLPTIDSHHGQSKPSDVVDLIHSKAINERLDRADPLLIDAYTRGYVVPMNKWRRHGIFLNGIERRGDPRSRSPAMIASGETMDFSGLSRKTTDKH